MPRYLNVRYGKKPTVIDVDQYPRLEILLEVIQTKFSGLASSYPTDLELYRNNERVWTMAEVLALSAEFFEEGPSAKYLEVRISVPVDPFPAKSGDSFEGFPDPSKPRHERPVLVNRIAEILESKMSLLITSPSCTGKTSLAYLIYTRMQNLGHNVNYVSLAPLFRSTDQPQASFDELETLFKSVFNMSVLQIMKSEGYLILDETQNIYHLSSFWGNMKRGAQVRRILAFAAFGLSIDATNPSPSQFQEKWYYNDVKFSDQECSDLLESFRQKKPINQELLVPGVLGDLFKFLNNHPGLVYMALHALTIHLTRSPYNVKTAVELQGCVAKGHLLNYLFSKARCFENMTYQNIKTSLGPNADNIIEDLIAKEYVDIPTISRQTSPLLSLHRSGMCIADALENKLGFSSEIMRVFYRDLYYDAVYGVAGSNVVLNWSSETIQTIIRKILSLFNSQALINTQSVGQDGKRYERIYQNEFYRCIYLLAPSRCHPDVGPIFGSTGFLDFYLDDNIQWGFELLRNGHKLQGHFDRFDPTTGRYSGIPLNDYAIIDFYEADTILKPRTGTNYFQVVFSRDFLKCDLMYGTSCNEIIFGK